MGVRISAMVNTLNEEEDVGQCLESLGWVDEIVVVDMYSDDRTVEICQRYTDKIFYHPRTQDGIVNPARNFTLGMTTGEWVLMVDADERVPPPLAAKLRDMVDGGCEADVILFSRKNFMCGKWLRHGGWYPADAPKFFRRTVVDIPPTKVHVDGVRILSDRVAVLRGEEYALVHDCFKTVGEYFRKTRRCNLPEARDWLASGVELPWYCMLTMPIEAFMGMYIRHRGYRDGLVGLIAAIGAGYRAFMCNYHYQQLRRRRATGP